MLLRALGRQRAPMRDAGPSSCSYSITVTDPGDSDRSRVERALKQRLEELQAPLEQLAKPPERGALLGFGKRIGDGTTEAISRLTDVGVGASLEKEADRVLRALAKLDEGTYGLCDACGAPIAPARLDAAPASVLCIACASKARPAHR
jgi:DnaK suppressor protein